MGWLDRLGSSYWFLPSLLVLASLALSAGTLALDQSGGRFSSWLPWFGGIQRADGARTLLSTVAGSIITVAGVVFSMTMVTMSLASQQFGPRLLGNFMRDRGNQLVLGTFVATFVYCLMVLRAVRSADPVSGVVAFVPQFSLAVAVLLTMASLGVLLYFIHHTAESMQVSYVLARVSRDLTAHILAFPEAQPARDLGSPAQAREFGRVGSEEHLVDTRAGARPGTQEAADTAEAEREEGDAGEGTPQGAGASQRSADIEGLPEEFEQRAVTIRAKRGGYVQSIDRAGLLALAVEQVAVLRLHHPPGSLVMLDGPFADIYPPEAVDAVAGRIQTHYLLGPVRTPTQDPYFLFDQLLEVAVRALSPGINDPFTATACVDRIAESLNLLSRRHLPPPTHSDDEGTVRLVVPYPELGPLTHHLFAELRAYGAGDPLVASHLAVTLRRMQASTDNDELIRAAELEIERLLESATGRLTAADYKSLEGASKRVSRWLRLED